MGPVAAPPEGVMKMQCHRAGCLLPGPSADGRQLFAFGDALGRVDLVEYRAGGSGFANADSFGGPAVTGATAGVTCLCSLGGGSVPQGFNAQQEVLVGYDDGSLIWWSLGGNGETVNAAQQHSDKFEDTPVSLASTSMSSTVAAFGSGVLRVFSGKMRLAEIAAHARWITGMSSFPNSIVATVAEDTVLNVWQISDDHGVSLLHSSVVTDKQLTGVSFAQGTPTPEVFVVAYDSDQLFRLKNYA